MTKQKFTVFLIPDTEGYQAIIPHYPKPSPSEIPPTRLSLTPREALSLILEDEQEPVPPNVQASHVIVGDIELNLPDPLLEEVRLFSEDKQALAIS